MIRNLNVRSEFRIKQSLRAYRVELLRDGEPYITSLDGLSRQCAECEVRSLSALWVKNRSLSFQRTPVPGGEGDIGRFEPASYSDGELGKIKHKIRQQECGFGWRSARAQHCSLLQAPP